VAGVAALGVILAALLAGVPAGSIPEAAAQPAAAQELSTELRYVPADAAMFLHVDVPAVWDHKAVKAIRNADAKFTEEVLRVGREAFGHSPDDLKTVVAFLPKVKDPRDMSKFGLVITFKNGFDAKKLQKGAEEFLPKDLKPVVKAINDRTALVLVNLEEEYAKPQPADASGPLAAALREASQGKHAAIGGVTFESLPDEIRAINVPAPFRPFQPIFKSTCATATINLKDTLDIEVRVRAGTAGQAIECEKSLGVLLGLIQDTLNEGIAELDRAKEPAVMDLIALMKVGIASTKGAKFSTLGNEARVSVSLPLDLPLAGAFLTAKQKVQDAAAATSSVNNLKQIGLAMHNYHDSVGNFPPAAVCDKTGKPMLSWRVLILPYIGQENLYKEFKLDEPWDSEHNKKLLAKMPKVYAIPGKNKPGDTDTHYRVFAGNGAGFDWVMGGKIQNITDGTSNTFLCATAEHAVPWTKPDEIEFDPEKDMTKLIGLVVNGRMQVVMFDGSVRTLAKIPDRKTLNALITRAGGEVIQDFDR
jgi:hypothetical protein